MPTIAQVLDAIYNPGIVELKNKIPIIQQQGAADLDSVRQAQINAFKGVTDTINAGGVGLGPLTKAESDRYLGATFMPALASLASEQNKAVIGTQSLVSGQRMSRGRGKFDLGDTTRQRKTDIALQEAALAQEESLAKKKIRADLTIQRMERAAAERERAAANVLTPKEQAEADIQDTLRGALKNPKRVKDFFREDLKSALLRKYGGVVGEGEIQYMLDNYFPNEWEKQYGIRK